MEPTTTGNWTLYNFPATREGTALPPGITNDWHLADVENAKLTTVCRRQKSFVYGKDVAIPVTPCVNAVNLNRLCSICYNVNYWINPAAYRIWLMQWRQL